MRPCETSNGRSRNFCVRKKSISKGVRRALAASERPETILSVRSRKNRAQISRLPAARLAESRAARARNTQTQTACLTRKRVRLPRLANSRLIAPMPSRNTPNSLRPRPSQKSNCRPVAVQGSIELCSFRLFDFRRGFRGSTEVSSRSVLGRSFVTSVDFFRFFRGFLTGSAGTEGSGGVSSRVVRFFCENSPLIEELRRFGGGERPDVRSNLEDSRPDPGPRLPEPRKVFRLREDETLEPCVSFPNPDDSIRFTSLLV
mgnify:CR=1 FL=1